MEKIGPTSETEDVDSSFALEREESHLFKKKKGEKKESAALWLSFSDSSQFSGDLWEL